VRHRPALAPLLAAALAIAAFGGAESPPEGVDAALWSEGRRAYLEVGGSGCSECHGRFAANELGQAPVIRGADAAQIRSSVANMDAMAFLQGVVTDAEIEAIVHYLAHLQTMTPVVVVRRRGALIPAEVVVPADTHVQLILDNQDRGACTWRVVGVGAAPLPGRTTGAVDWRTGGPGRLTASCEENPDTTLEVRVE
jgi:mono/diheme cytochrome c family protein